MRVKNWNSAKYSRLQQYKNASHKMQWQTKQVNINRNGKKKKISGEVSPR